MVQRGQISSPGRICLFGEHQDYLGLPIIPAAINKRLNLYYHLENSPTILELSSKQLNQTEMLRLKQAPKLTGSPFDYQKAVLQHFWNEMTSPLPSKIVIDCDIPIRSGLSSSAALLTTMVFLIKHIALNCKSPLEEIAEIAYHCEHDLMGISCGRMDQYACSIGRVFHMTSTESPKVTPLNLSNDVYLIIGDSQIERKADIPLKTVQQDIFQALHLLGSPNLNSLSEKTIMNSFI
ncbi:MAG: galactokinase family protein [Candidatus Heimdallarchaeota archaeon]